MPADTLADHNINRVSARGMSSSTTSNVLIRYTGGGPCEARVQPTDEDRERARFRDEAIDLVPREPESLEAPVAAHPRDEVFGELGVSACRDCTERTREEVGLVGDCQLRVVVEHALQERRSRALAADDEEPGVGSAWSARG